MTWHVERVYACCRFEILLQRLHIEAEEEWTKGASLFYPHGANKRPDLLDSPGARYIEKLIKPMAFTEECIRKEREQYFSSRPSYKRPRDAQGQENVRVTASRRHGHGRGCGCLANISAAITLEQNFFTLQRSPGARPPGLFRVPQSSSSTLHISEVTMNRDSSGFVSTARVSAWAL